MPSRILKQAYSSGFSKCHSRVNKTQQTDRVPDQCDPGWLLSVSPQPWERGKPFCQQVGKDRPLLGQPPFETQRLPELRILLNRVVSHTGPGPWSSIKKKGNRNWKHKETKEVLPSLGSQPPPRSVALSPHPPRLPRFRTPSTHKTLLTCSDGYATICAPTLNSIQ